jgi:hypothetical protein
VLAISQRYQKAGLQSKTDEQSGDRGRNGGITQPLFTCRRQYSGMAKQMPVRISLKCLRQQHHDAGEMAATIVSCMTAYRDEFDAMPIALLIGKLNALLRVHLAYEDTVLYPMMIDSADAEVAARASGFREEAGSLAPKFEEFARRWSGPSIIAILFDQFREEATELLVDLGARIEREHDLIYPLAERALTATA